MLSEPPKLKKQDWHYISVIVDRLVAKPDGLPRVTDSIETALKLSVGTVEIDLVDVDENDPKRVQRYSEK